MSTDSLEVNSPTKPLWRSAVEIVAKAITCMVAVPVGYLVASFAGWPRFYAENVALIGSVWAITAWCLVVCSATFESWYLKRYRRLGFPFWAALGLALGALPIAALASIAMVMPMVTVPA